MRIKYKDYSAALLMNSNFHRPQRWSDNVAMISFRQVLDHAAEHDYGVPANMQVRLTCATWCWLPSKCILTYLSFCTRTTVLALWEN